MKISPGEVVPVLAIIFSFISLIEVVVSYPRKITLEDNFMARRS